MAGGAESPNPVVQGTLRFKLKGVRKQSLVSRMIEIGIMTLLAGIWRGGWPLLILI